MKLKYYVAKIALNIFRLIIDFIYTIRLVFKIMLLLLLLVKSKIL